MLSKTSLHPVLRFADILLCLLAGAATIVISGLVNPHSVAWLVGIYTTVALLIAALRSARKSPLLRSFALYLAMLALYLLVVWLAHILIPGHHPEEAKRLFAFGMRFLCLGSVYMAVTLFHFTLRFAEAKSRLLHWIEWVGWLASTYFFALNLAGRFCKDFRWGGYTWVPTLEGGYRYSFYLTSFYVTLGILVPVVKLFTTSSQQRRMQLLYYLLGGIPLWLSCWSHFLISLGINLYPAGGVLLLLHSGILGYAVLRRRVFNITVVVRRGFAYAAVSLALGMLYGLLLILVPLEESHTSGALPAILLVLIAGLVYAPLMNLLQKLLQKIVDRFFFRATPQRQDSLEQFGREMATTVQLEHVARALCRLVQECFQPRRVSLYLNDSEGKVVLYASCEESFSLGRWPEGVQLPQDIQAAIGADLSAKQVRWPQAPSSQQALSISEVDEALAVPIWHRLERLGCLVLEPKRADEPYTERDVRFAESVAAHSSSILLNARSFAQLERLQLLTTATLEGLSTGVLLVASSGRVVRANSAAQSICLAEDAGALSTLDKLWEHQPILGSAIRRAVADGRPRDNQELCLEGTKRLFVLMSTRELESRDAERLFLITLNDITEYREMENIVQRGKGLARVGEAISAINHEIKNVLQPVRYQVEKMAQMGERDKRTVDRALAIITDRLSALEKLLANLKDLSRPIELRLRPVNLPDLVDSVWRDLKEAPIASGVLFRTEILDSARECYADGHWLRQVVYNLVRNAIEATSGAERPEVCVGTAINKPVFEICIRDNGCGMDEATVQRLFELFFSTKGESGTGLGLSICRKIVELHRGKISVQSQVGLGTTFRVALPYDERSSGIGLSERTSREK